MVRWISLLIGVLNLGIVLLGGILLDSVVSGFSATAKILIATTTLIAGVRVAAMVGAARAQHAAAENIAGIWRTVPSPSTALFATRDGCSDILKWRSFYATHDTAWKAHYREDCLEEDEVYSVARLLGDLVAYRASRTGHLELLQEKQLRVNMKINKLRETVKAHQQKADIFSLRERDLLKHDADEVSQHQAKGENKERATCWFQ
ncbi:uncharacterized protein LOC109712883 isoform X2 [Ananas comosus]|uniref:Uncharacterized protein LOC109712883 isoform X2 n=1 Tax=Ananas comosus TaxID=4615 RepID=A0A6P5FFP8_ANACO|nr:uncharacterized protein LOC109712883 isoform X2 [Ananas comosus]